MRSFIWLIFFSFGFVTVSFAQGDDMMKMFDSEGSKVKEEVSATFKATRIINGSSVESLGQGVLDFRISHRFGQINQGSENFYGLDNATTRIGLDYGITKWMMVGIGHSAFNKENDGSLKIKLLKQKHNGFPVTLSYAGSVSVQTTTAPTLPAGESWLFSNRLCYTNQLLIARKFNDFISFQLMPTVVHHNLVDSSKYSNNTVALGFGGRIKLNKRIAITGEYYYNLTNANALYNGIGTFNSFSLGIDIETGGHVFQLMLTNSQGLTDRTFITETTDSWKKGALHFGFNISRVFTVVKPKEFRTGGGKHWW